MAKFRRLFKVAKRKKIRQTKLVDALKKRREIDVLSNVKLFFRVSTLFYFDVEISRCEVTVLQLSTFIFRFCKKKFFPFF